MCFSFHFSSLYPAPYIDLYVSLFKFHIWILEQFLVLPKMASSAQKHKSMSCLEHSIYISGQDQGEGSIELVCPSQVLTQNVVGGPTSWHFIFANKEIQKS